MAAVDSRKIQKRLRRQVQWNGLILIQKIVTQFERVPNQQKNCKGVQGPSVSYPGYANLPEYLVDEGDQKHPVPDDVG